MLGCTDDAGWYTDDFIIEHFDFHDLLNLDGGSTDNCGVSETITSPQNITCADLGSVTGTLTVVGGSGDTSYCTANIAVLDTLAVCFTCNTPTAACNDITVYLDATGNASITTGDVNNGSTTDCGLQSMSLDKTAFDCSNIPNHNVVLTVTDINSDTATCSATITVEDTIAPVALCNDLTVYLDSNLSLIHI